MMPFHRFGVLIASALLCALPAAAATAEAQTPPAPLWARMDAFAAALRDEAPLEEVASFFPHRSTWEMVQTPEDDAPRGSLGRHRFAPEHTLPAIGEGGPVCASIGGLHGHFRSADGTVVRQAQRHRRPWRYVGGRRFVPPAGGARSPIFVEWREEDGGWVVARIGERYHPVDEAWLAYSPPNSVSRDSTAAVRVPPERRFAMHETWYRNSDVIHFRRGRFHKFGLPRSLEDHELEQVGWLDAAPVFVEKGGRLRPEILYVRAAPPRDYQPYQGHGTSVCRE